MKQKVMKSMQKQRLSVFLLFTRKFRDRGRDIKPMKKLFKNFLVSALFVIGITLSVAASSHDVKGEKVRFEVFNEDGSIEGVDIPASLLLEPSGKTRNAVPKFQVQKILDNGPDEENMVITIMGDGFTQDQQSYFTQQAQATKNYFLNGYPYSEFKNRINVYAINVISNQSGAASNPSSLIDNYFGSTFYFGGGPDRLLYTTYMDKVRELRDAYTPKCDQVVILVNTTTYGGGGGEFTVASLDSSVESLVLHEAGHSFGGLADEYWYRGYEAPNMTSNNNPNTNRWKFWLNREGIGIYPHEESPNWYRPHQNCLMRYLSMPFCEVCSTEITRRLANRSNEVFYKGDNSTSIIVPNGKTRIVDYTFVGCDDLVQVSLPKSVTSVGRYAFLGCNSLTSVSVEAITPPDINGKNVFVGVNLNNTTLYVPIGKKQEYINAGWTGFKDIVEVAPTITNTPIPTPTNTPIPTPTNTPIPTPTNTPIPTPTNTQIPTSINTPILTPTNTPASTVTPMDTPAPTTKPLATPISMTKPPLPVAVKSIKTMSKVYVVEGKSVKLPATVQPYNAANKTYTWKSSDEKIATVTNKGEVKVQKNTAGKTVKLTITSKDGNKKAFCTVYVVKKKTALKSIKVKQIYGIGLLEKQTKQIKVTLNSKKATGIVPKFTSSNKKVATVDKMGFVTAHSLGITKITVKAGKIKKTVTVTVGKVKATGIKLNKTKAIIKKGSGLTLKAKVMTPQNVNPTKITWVSSNKKVATVNSKGKVTAKNKGKATITAYTWSGKKVTCKVTVK